MFTISLRNTIPSWVIGRKNIYVPEYICLERIFLDCFIMFYVVIDVPKKYAQIQSELLDINTF